MFAKIFFSPILQINIPPLPLLKMPVILSSQYNTKNPVTSIFTIASGINILHPSFIN